jgi:hypothetical protein
VGLAWTAGETNMLQVLALSKTVILCPYLSTVHDFIPFNALSDMHFHALDAILCPCLKVHLSFPVLVCATVWYKYSVKNYKFVSK